MHLNLGAAQAALCHVGCTADVQSAQRSVDIGVVAWTKDDTMMQAHQQGRPRAIDPSKTGPSRATIGKIARPVNGKRSSGGFRRKVLFDRMLSQVSTFCGVTLKIRSLAQF